MLLPLLLNNLLTTHNRVWKSVWKARADKQTAAADFVVKRVIAPVESDIIPAQDETQEVTPEVTPVVATEVEALAPQIEPEQIEPITLEAMQRAVADSIAGMAGTEITRPLIESQEREAARLEKIRKNNQIAIMFIMASL